MVVIPIDAITRQEQFWYNPDSLCRTCVYLYKKEDWCEINYRKGIDTCSAYFEEIRTSDQQKILT